MGAILLALIGLYAILTAFRGNGTTLINDLGEDAPSFVPWAASIIALALVYKIDILRPLVKGILVVAALTLVLKNSSALVTNIKQLYNQGKSATSSFGVTASSTSPTQQATS